MNRSHIEAKEATPLDGNTLCTLGHTPFPHHHHHHNPPPSMPLPFPLPSRLSQSRSPLGPPVPTQHSAAKQCSVCVSAEQTQPTARQRACCTPLRLVSSHSSPPCILTRLEDPQPQRQLSPPPPPLLLLLPTTSTAFVL